MYQSRFIKFMKEQVFRVARENNDDLNLIEYQTKFIKETLDDLGMNDLE